MTSRYGATRADYEAWMAEHDHPRYRVQQVWDALYRQRRPLETVTNLPATLRDEVAAAFPTALVPLVEQRGDHEQTRKWLFATTDGSEIETVLMLSPGRATVCVSSQAGCAMACTFCATGQAGFTRHLDAGEIVEQVMAVAHQSPQPVTNVVFMGMGEPLANYDATWAAVERLHGDVRISARRITVSTVGIVPGIRRLTAEVIPVTLAVSLHAADDDLRSSMIPVNRRYPLTELVAAAHGYGQARGRRVTFEYACIEGVNDQPEHALRLAELLRPLGPLGAHVNLIPLNRTAAFDGTAPAGASIRAFAAALHAEGLNATVRRNRGTDIDAACGQLRDRATGTHTPSSTRMPG
ncbi:MAG: 23S rRNA (adenine(2503)-C(2))-methyltransferase RlmN [Acidimicrobiia bacterium]